MTISHLGAARLFLFARGRGGENAAEDIAALTKLLDEVAITSIQTIMGAAIQIRKECAQLGPHDLEEIFARRLRDKVRLYFGDLKSDE